MNAGIVVPFAGPESKIPSGWEQCDGRIVSRTDARYTNLFDAIGTTYGGDGVDSFRLPDYRGIFLRGVAGKRDDDFVDPDRDSRLPPSPNDVNVGNKGNNVGSLQNDAYLAHDHPIHDPGHGHPIGLGRKGGGNLEGPQHGSHFYGFGTKWGAGPVGTGISVQPIGGPETRPSNAYVNWIIKL